MCKKLICLSVAMLVVAPVVASGATKGPVGWWKFDETSGTTAVDSVGARNGKLMPDNAVPPAAWVAGQIGGAIQFGHDGAAGSNQRAATNPYVLLPIGDLISTLGDATFAIWVNWAGSTYGDWQRILDFGSDTATNFYLSANRAGTASTRTCLRTATVGEQGGNSSTANRLQANGWHHVAVGFNQTTMRIWLYIDGVAVGNWGTSLMPRDLGATTNNMMAKSQYNDPYFVGTMDDLRIYDRFLSADDLISVMAGGIGYGAANTPGPANKATDVLRDQTLSWAAGVEGVKRDVYFGTDPANLTKVASAQAELTFNPGRLQFATSYYWRVDEISTDGTVYAGNPWTFKTEPLAYALATAAITPTASSYVAGNEPNKTIGGTTTGLDANDFHGIDPKTMWLTDAKATDPAWIQYTFDKPYVLHDMWVWNYNSEFEADLGYGFFNTTVEYSTDGTTWTKLGDFEFADGTTTADYAHNTTISFGDIYVKAVKLTPKDNYVGLPQFGLSEVRFNYIRAFADTPTPTNNATGVAPSVTMTWRPGRGAATHNVLIGTDPNNLTQVGSVAASGVTASFNPTTLQLGANVYYWRVDEVNNANAVPVVPSATWRLAMPPFQNVDDMESYNDTTNGIFNTWADGYNSSTNGSQVGNPAAPFAERTIVQNGSQSMPFFFANTTSEPISEATRTYTTAPNWAVGGIKTLVMFVFADGNNVGNGKLYIKVNGTQVDYTGSLTPQVWTRCSLDLSKVSSLAAVNTLTIGVSGVGASGKLLIDSIQLWNTDVDTTVKDPGTANLVSYFNMEGGKVADSVSGVTAVNLNATTFVDSMPGFGKALMCSGGTTADTTQFVDIGATYWDKVVSQLSSCTFSVWTNYTGVGAIWQRVFDFGSGTNVNTYISSSGASMGIGQFAVKTNVPNAGSTATGYTEILVRSSRMSVGWHHLAGVVDNSGAYPTMAIYLDGVLSGGPVAGRLPKDMVLQTAWQNYFGKSNWPDPYLNGAVDELRVYNRTLTAGETAYLAGKK